MLLKLIDALHDLAGLAEEAQVLALAFQRLVVKPLELGLVVEGVEMTNAATAEDLHDPFRLRRKMRLPRGRGYGPGLFATQQPRQRHAAQPDGGVGEKVAARNQRGNA